LWGGGGGGGGGGGLVLAGVCAETVNAEAARMNTVAKRRTEPSLKRTLVEIVAFPPWRQKKGARTGHGVLIVGPRPLCETPLIEGVNCGVRDCSGMLHGWTPCEGKWFPWGGNYSAWIAHNHGPQMRGTVGTRRVSGGLGLCWRSQDSAPLQLLEVSPCYLFSRELLCIFPSWC